MPVARPETSDGRVIAHLDMDCFYVQVEQRKQPELRGLPTAVVQYNSWKGGGLIAVSYEARKYGVKRSMRGDEAKKVCPQIQLVQVPVARGKADLSIYRDAGSEVVSILARKGRCERASIDEVYLDLSDAAETMLAQHPPESLGAIDEEALKSHMLGLNNEDGNDAKERVKEWLCNSEASHRDKLLACGALIVAELRMQVLKETEFTCSAGVAHNKMLAKLASAMNKPAQQTVVPHSSVKDLLSSFPIKKMKQLGGKLGSSLQSDLGVNVVGDLLQFSAEKLQERYGINTGNWLWNIARGINGEEVEGRLLPKSHGSGKTFPGRQALKTIASVQHWLNQLCEELSERLQADLDQNKRIAGTLTLHARAYKNSDTESEKNFPSKSCPLRYGAAKMQEDALSLFQAGLREYLGSYMIKGQGSQCNGWGITSLSVSASKIIAIASGTSSITKYFHGHHPSSSLSKQSEDSFIPKAVPLPTSGVSGSESCSGLISTEAPIDFHEEGTVVRYIMPGSDKLEKNQMDPPCCSSKQIPDGSTQETSPLPPSGSECGSEMNKIEHRTEVATGKPRIELIMHGVESHEQKRNKLKDKEASSILRFFKNNSSPMSIHKHELPEFIPDGNAPPPSGAESGSPSISETGEVQMPKETPTAETSGHRVTHHPDQDNQGRQVWSYRIDEVDPSVIDELPPEIQREVRAWLRPHKRPNVGKRGSSIAHYFSPMKKPH